MSKILVLRGPNLNLVGTRKPASHGTDTLTDINPCLLTIAEATRIEFAAEAAIRRLKGNSKFHP